MSERRSQSQQRQLIPKPAKSGHAPLKSLSFVTSPSRGLPHLQAGVTSSIKKHLLIPSRVACTHTTCPRETVTTFSKPATRAQREQRASGNSTQHPDWTLRPHGCTSLPLSPLKGLGRGNEMGADNSTIPMEASCRTSTLRGSLHKKRKAG